MPSHDNYHYVSTYRVIETIHMKEHEHIYTYLEETLQSYATYKCVYYTLDIQLFD